MPAKAFKLRAHRPDSSFWPTFDHSSYRLPAKSVMVNIRSASTFTGVFSLCVMMTVAELVKVFYENKVYLTPHWEMHAPVGWFRVVFSVYSDDDFQTGKSTESNSSFLTDCNS